VGRRAAEEPDRPRRSHVLPVRPDRPALSYRTFARFYDAVQGDGAERAAYLRELIAEHHPSARTVLELACGTGSMLAQLRPDYAVTGLDLSPQMLAVAREKVPDVRLVEGDMTAFRLEERFDVVLCVFDSINHLLDYAAWEAVFGCAHAHLAAGGIFVFDINSEERLAALRDHPAVAEWFGDDNLLALDVRQAAESEAVVWELRIFEHEGGGRYRLHAEDIVETSFPRERVEASLRERFERVAAYDRRGRLYFVAGR
jgi:SAM-dependent methyltransferase